MSDARKLGITIAVLVLMLCAGTSIVTRDAMRNLSFLSQPSGNTAGDLVDQRPWQTAQALAPLAVSTEELLLAREAQRLADHEVDQAFAMALRQASTEKRVLTGDALALQKKVAELQQTVRADQARVESLEQQAKGPNGASVADDLDVAKAQAGLDNDELTDETQDLARVSGDKRTKIQQELATREASMKKYDERASGQGETAVISAGRYGTLYGRMRAWLQQRSRHALLLQAQQQAMSDAADLQAQHTKLEAETNAVGASLQAGTVASGAADSSAASTGSKQSRIAALQGMSARRSILAILGDREETQKQLAATYGKWAAQVNLQHRIVLHLMVQSVAWIAAIVLATLLAGWLIHVGLTRMNMERRRLQTTQTILQLGTEVIALLLILVVIFGAPKQTPTILGLATAGLTVVFQDFILAFFGWFVLMGKNGISVGDWVEIDGVGGEVVDIGLFRTALLETGNWTDKGHPTGRRITFVNKFAVTGQYFNFSTEGQWMWDEIKVTIPNAPDSVDVIKRIHEAVIGETEKDSKLAEQEWQRATKQKSMSQFSATPSVDVRPAVGGVDLIVRYVTRASDRFEVGNRLYEKVVSLLNRPSVTAGKES